MVLCLFHKVMQGRHTVWWTRRGQVDKISFGMVLADSNRLISLIAVLGSRVARLLIPKWHEIARKLRGRRRLVPHRRLKFGRKSLCSHSHLLRRLFHWQSNCSTEWSARDEISEAILLSENFRAIGIGHESMDVFLEGWASGRNKVYRKLLTLKNAWLL